jgi:hypothetical protein
VVFVYNEKNKVVGHSITDFTGENQTRTSITGYYDTLNNTFSFNELSNISSNLDVPDSTFCYVSAQKLKIKNTNNNKIISGEF